MYRQTVVPLAYLILEGYYLVFWGRLEGGSGHFIQKALSLLLIEKL